MKIQAKIVALFGIFSMCWAAPNEMVIFACQFFNEMFDDCSNINEGNALGQAMADISTTTATSYYSHLESPSNSTVSQNGEEEPTTCSSNPEVTNGATTSTPSSFEVGTIIEYQCNLGYRTEGENGTLTCKDDGQYEQSIQCLEEPITCSSNPEVTNGATTSTPSSFEVGTIIEYQCNLGYRTEGENGTLTCKDDGQYEQSIQCLEEPITCSSSPEVTHGAITSTHSSFEVGTIIDFQCNPGYTTEGRKGTLTCKDDGQYKQSIQCLDCRNRDRLNTTGRFLRSDGQRPDVCTFKQCKKACEDNPKCIEISNYDGCGKCVLSFAIQHPTEDLEECRSVCYKEPRCVQIKLKNGCKLMVMKYEDKHFREQSGTIVSDCF
ncbi:hypothetical protein LOTGIDRAFT_167276 [Lottia gigantea]|uniref:Sushi domain-containing protein n=1 Tax=Lottia gigantea TaxID=225164 RepID=V3ZZN6_LOTGI|nr:hypothetical protein LOTGIDRAFT_167276 [Lottia gigantea]ESO86461.1 hypothetical protein LOTGIDRAFT_167276 [Lottia gigantea]